MSAVERQQKGPRAIEADTAVRRALNALSTTSSFVSALIQDPGPSGAYDSTVQATKTMLKAADEVTQDLVRELNLSEVPWAKFRIMKVVSAAVSESWVASSKRTGVPSADVSWLVPVWKELASHEVPSLVFDEAPDSSRIASMCALLDAMEPVMREIGIFELFHDPKVAALHARDLITSYAQQALEDLIDPAASVRSKNHLLQALLRNAGTIYATCWRSHAEDVVESLRNMDPVQQRFKVESNPNGFPLKPIDTAFAESFFKLVDMMSLLAAPKSLQAAVEVPATVGPSSVVSEKSFGPDEIPLSSLRPDSSMFDQDSFDPRDVRASSV